MSLRRRALMKQARLPSEYQEVEYLYSKYDGEQARRRIDTGITVRKTKRFVCDVRTETYSLFYFLFGGSVGIDELFIYLGSYDEAPVYVLSPLNVKFELSNERKTVVFDLLNGRIEVNGSIVTEGVVNDFNTGYDFPIQLFKANRAIYDFYGPGYFYSFQAFDNNILTNYFIPCYRKSDNKPGMYDLCGSICPLTNSPFYINAGTGEFTVGPDVN